MSLFFHEQIYRTKSLMEKLQTYPITVCGGGAIGANLIENLARTGLEKLKVIDRDRVEERNLSTQPYYKTDVGAYKAKILSNSLYRALGVSIEPITKELTTENCSQLLKKTKLVIDAFDNSIARQAVFDYCYSQQIPCLHVGLETDYAEIIWNNIYRVPSATKDDLCDYPLARNLVLTTVAIASEVIISHIATGEEKSYTFTLKDFAVKPFNL